MANEEKRSGGGGRTATAAGIVALLLLLGGGGYFGLGLGGGPGGGTTGSGTQQEQEAEQPGEEEPDAEAQETEAADEAQQTEQVPDVIVVTIKRDKVTINGHEVANKDELRKYVEEYNSDSRTFTLEEDESILETYNWVKEVFDELDIQLKNSK